MDEDVFVSKLYLTLKSQFDFVSVATLMEIVNSIKQNDLFIHNGEFHEIIEVDMSDGTDEYYKYDVYVVPTDEEEDEYDDD